MVEVSPMSKRAFIISGLYKLGVDISDIAEIVYTEQSVYIKDITRAECIDAVNSVLGKYEVQHAVLVALELDRLVNEGSIKEPLNKVLVEDSPNFGVDEIIVKSALNLYGSIADTNFGYLDKEKPGIIGVLNNRQKNGDSVTIFMDDAVAALAACAEALVASRRAPKN